MPVQAWHQKSNEVEEITTKILTQPSVFDRLKHFEGFSKLTQLREFNSKLNRLINLRLRNRNKN